MPRVFSRPLAGMPRVTSMNAGRNDPCPCGSGKKYKKCCLGKDREALESQARAVTEAQSSSDASRSLSSLLQAGAAGGPATQPRVAKAPPPPQPRDPIEERADICWKDF